MRAELKDTTCCGMGEIHYIDSSEPHEILSEAYRQLVRPYYAFIVFTGITPERYGQDLRSYILRNNLGEVVESKSRLNTNSGNRIKAYIWSPNYDNWRAWYRKNY